MTQEDQINRVLIGMQKEIERDDQETLNLDRLVVLADTDGLIRMGLELMEALCQGRRTGLMALSGTRVDGAH